MNSQPTQEVTRGRVVDEDGGAGRADIADATGTMAGYGGLKIGRPRTEEHRGSMRFLMAGLSVSVTSSAALLFPTAPAFTAAPQDPAVESCSVKPVFPIQFVVSPETRHTPVVLRTSCLLRAPVTLKLVAVCQTGAGPCSQGTVTWRGNSHGVVGDGARAYLTRDQQLAGADFFPAQPVRVSPTGLAHTMRTSFRVRGGSRVTIRVVDVKGTRFIVGQTSVYYAATARYEPVQVNIRQQYLVNGKWRAVPNPTVDYLESGAFYSFADGNKLSGRFRIVALPNSFTALSVSRVVSFKEPRHPIPPNAD